MRRSPFLDDDEPTAAEIVQRIIADTEYEGLTREDVLRHVDWRALFLADFEAGYERSEIYTRVHAEAVDKARAEKAN